MLASNVCYIWHGFAVKRKLPRYQNFSAVALNLLARTKLEDSRLVRLWTHRSGGRIVDRTTFLTNLGRSGLLSDDEFHDVEGRFPAETPAPSMAQALVSDNRLTPYQAQQLLSDRARRLVLGQYQILEEIGR